MYSETIMIVQRGDGSFRATHKQLDVSASGSTESEALRMLADKMEIDADENEIEYDESAEGYFITDDYNSYF